MAKNETGGWRTVAVLLTCMNFEGVEMIDDL